ncbi:MAG TPA: response regulator transcription factor [Egibacteraceae bacterium]|nr:response regulator transcription factor [Egibacteraceae bacterium]
MRQRTKVFLVDDHALFRSGIRSEIADRVWIVGEAGDVAGAVAGIRATQPHVVLLDVHLPDGAGRAVIEQVHDSDPDVQFLALSASDAAEDVIDTIRAGARGYVTKTVSADDLVDAIVRVADGDAAFSPRLAGFVLDAFAAIPVADVDEELAQLTPREREILQHLARGYTYKEIAARLYISVKTVESHASAVLRKLQLDNRHQLSRWAAERNIR